MRFYVTALVLGTLMITAIGCEATDGTGTADSGAGREAGSIIGGQVGREHGYLGGQVGGLIGQQTERTMRQER